METLRECGICSQLIEVDVILPPVRCCYIKDSVVNTVKDFNLHPDSSSVRQLIIEKLTPRFRGSLDFRCIDGNMIVCASCLDKYGIVDVLKKKFMKEQLIVPIPVESLQQGYAQCSSCSICFPSGQDYFDSSIMRNTSSSYGIFKVVDEFIETPPLARSKELIRKVPRIVFERVIPAHMDNWKWNLVTLPKEYILLCPSCSHMALLETPVVNLAEEYTSTSTSSTTSVVATENGTSTLAPSTPIETTRKKVSILVER